jgi:hypothetical protein
VLPQAPFDEAGRDDERDDRPLKTVVLADSLNRSARSRERRGQGWCGCGRDGSLAPWARRLIRDLAPAARARDEGHRVSVEQQSGRRGLER